MYIGVGTLIAALAVAVPVLAAVVGLALRLAVLLGKHATLLEAQAKREEHIAMIPSMRVSLATMESNFGALATRVHEMHTRIVVVERTKRSRDDMPAVRPGSYRGSRPGED